MRILEIGTGSGGISHYFASHPSGRFRVDAVDVIDNRLVQDGFRFTLVADTKLPFGDGVFDVVITNHVIEHVGGSAAQQHHLEEVRRVLGPTGIAYLAVPNRWMLIEPHYRLLFLSWLPRQWRSPYLRFCRRGNFYDCEPLQLDELERMLRGAGFAWRHMEIEALRIMQEIEPRISVIARMALCTPERFLNLVRPVIPTLICTLTHDDAAR